MSVWYLVLFAVALVIIGILVVRQVRRATSSEVWVARQALAPGAKVTSSSLELKRIANDSIPADAVREPSQVVGRTVAKAVQSGQPITTKDIGGSATIWAANVIPAGRVLATVHCTSGSLPTAEMREGDRIDILAVGKDGATRQVGHDTYMMAVIKGAAGGGASNVGGMIVPPIFRSRPSGSVVVGLLLALHPEDVAPIAQAEAAGERFKFVLQKRGETQVNILTARNAGHVDLITGSHREKVNVNP